MKRFPLLVAANKEESIRRFGGRLHQTPSNFRLDLGPVLTIDSISPKGLAYYDEIDRYKKR